MSIHLFRNDVASSDLDLLFFGVARESYDLHPVSQRGVHSIEHIRRGHKHYVRKIERHAKIVVAKRKVLLRVKHFEKSR